MFVYKNYTETDSFYSVKVSRSIKTYMLLFQEDTERWGNRNIRHLCTTLQQTSKLNDRLVLKQGFEFDKVAGKKKLQSATLVKYTHGCTSDEWSNLYFGVAIRSPLKFEIQIIS